jgi:PAS domain S-box-containing protein
MENTSTILIVDDTAIGRDTLESLLYGDSYELIFAENGKEAIRKAIDNNPDLILLDIMMPEMDGFEVCQRLRAEPSTAEVPIIIVTTLDDQQSRLKGIESGADDFVSKPFSRTELRARVSSILRLNRYRRLLKAQEQVQEQAYLLDIAQDAILVISLTDEITYWNKSAETIYGWSKSEAIGKDFKELICKTSTMLDIRTTTLEKGEWSGEVTNLRKDGKEIIVESRWTLVNNRQKEAKSIFIVNTDVTERKKLEAKFLRAQRLESVGALASGIAHDLNNILTPVLVSMQILKTKLTDPRSQRVTEIAELAVNRGVDLVKQILSFGRGIEASQIQLQIRYIISEISKILKETFPKSIHINTNLPQDLWTLLADATQIHQVLMNLCINARDAMPTGGSLNISAENFLVDEIYAQMNEGAKAGPHILITVEDTGTGIASELLDKIFDPFFTTKEVGKGTGLGLATVLSIIKAHNGFLQVSSQKGKGTRFKLFLPAIKDSNVEITTQHIVELPRGNQSLVLIVEDEASIREINKSSLEAYDYQVITAEDGARAIKIYGEHMSKIAIVVLDMVMPIMDGLSTIRVLKNLNPEVKIIAVSGLASKDTVNEALSLGINSYILKPYTCETLLNAIDQAMKN